MTDIRIDVELRHPADRVWLALTDPRLLAQWFAETEPAIESGVRFRMRPVGLAALDERITGEVLEVDPPRRLVMRWAGSDRRTVVACDLTPTADGCRLVFQEFPEIGAWRSAERDHREAAYQQSYGGRLPAVLDWLAFREVEFAPASAPATTTLEPEPEPADARHPRLVRRRLVVAGALLLAAATTTTVALASRGDTGPEPTSPALAPSEFVSATPPTTAPSSRRPPARAARPAPARTTAASRPATRGGATTAAELGQPVVAASYRTVSNRLFGYTGEVTVANSGTAAAPRWRVTVTLPGGATVASASGAEFDQDGREVVFTGPAVAAGASTRFEFEVTGDAQLGPKRPNGCVLDGEPCAGL